MFCSQCGNVIADGAKFCHKCGEQIGKPLGPPPLKPRILNSNPAAAQSLNSGASSHHLWKNFTITHALRILVVVIGGLFLFDYLTESTESKAIDAMAKATSQSSKVYEDNPDTSIQYLAPLFSKISIKGCPEEFVRAFNAHVAACEADDVNGWANYGKEMCAI